MIVFAFMFVRFCLNDFAYYTILSCEYTTMRMNDKRNTKENEKDGGRKGAQERAQGQLAQNPIIRAIYFPWRASIYTPLFITIPPINGRRFLPDVFGSTLMAISPALLLNLAVSQSFLAYSPRPSSPYSQPAVLPLQVLVSTPYRSLSPFTPIGAEGHLLWKPMIAGSPCVSAPHEP